MIELGEVKARGAIYHDVCIQGSVHRNEADAGQARPVLLERSAAHPHHAAIGMHIDAPDGVAVPDFKRVADLDLSLA